MISKDPSAYTSHFAPDDPDTHQLERIGKGRLSLFYNRNKMTYFIAPFSDGVIGQPVRFFDIPELASAFLDGLEFQIPPMKMTSFISRHVASCIIDGKDYERFSEKSWGQWMGESLEMVQWDEEVAALEAAYKIWCGNIQLPLVVDPSTLEPDRVVQIVRGKSLLYGLTAKGRIFRNVAPEFWDELPGPKLD